MSARWIHYSLALATALGPLGAGEVEVVREPAPDWVQRFEIDPSAQPTDEAEGSADVWFLICDQQQNEVTDTFFSRYAKRFVSENGVENGSQLSFVFDPTWQTLRFHELRIYRNGKVIDKLQTQSVTIAQREKGLEHKAYDGRLSAIMLLEDIRVGDVVEYSYSLTGRNPIFQGKYIDSFSTSWSQPVREMSFRLLWPRRTSRAFQWMAHGRKLEPAMREIELDGVAFTEYRWHDENIARVSNDGDLPPWFDPYGWVQLSEYKNWSEVAQWAVNLYRVDEELPEELRDEIERLSKLSSDEDKIKGAVRYVQDSIRYLQIAVGPHTHKPYDIETVLERRYGDCKDKSLLLTAMLRKLGFAAWPALVETDYRHKIEDWLPSPYAFDHLVVALEKDGRTHWLDPTRSHQRGNPGDIYFPDYGRALLVHPETTSLANIVPQGFPLKKVEVKEEIRIADYTSPASLSVETVYTGDAADTMRDYLKRNSPSQIHTNYLNFYAKIYPKVKADGLPQFEDDESANRITSRERYQIVDLWETSSSTPENLETEFYAQVVRSYLDRPETRVRTMPFGLVYPSEVAQTSRIYFPGHNFEAESERVEIDDPAFRFLYKADVEGNLLTLQYEYEALSSIVQANRTHEYIGNVQRALDTLSYPAWIEKWAAYNTAPPPSVTRQEQKEEYATARILAIGIVLAAFMAFLWIVSIFATVLIYRRILLARYPQLANWERARGRWASTQPPAVPRPLKIIPAAAAPSATLRDNK